MFALIVFMFLLCMSLCVGICWVVGLLWAKTENHGHRVHVTNSVLYLLTEEQWEGLRDGVLNCLNDCWYHKIRGRSKKHVNIFSHCSKVERKGHNSLCPSHSPATQIPFFGKMNYILIIYSRIQSNYTWVKG